jgi:phosphopantetheinyl transferase
MSTDHHTFFAINDNSNNIWLGYSLQLLTLQQCARWLTQDEQHYHSQLSAKRAVQFANGRALLRRTLHQQFQTACTDVQVSLPDGKAPTLTLGGQPWQLSISHSAQAVAVAFSHKGKLGLDIEQLKPRDYAEFSRQYPALSGSTQADDFYQRWTAAEAYSKLSNKALLDVLQHPLTGNYTLKHLPLSGYMLCLCYQHETAGITIIEERI